MRLGLLVAAASIAATFAAFAACSPVTREFQSAPSGGGGAGGGPSGSGAHHQGGGPGVGGGPGGSGGAGGASDCAAGEQRCQGNQPQHCVNGHFRDAAPCSDPVHYACVDGGCVGAPSCANLLNTQCGAAPAQANCCASPKVDGDTFFRNWAPGNQSQSFPATVSPFRLDTFLVSVDRFRAFVQAGNGVSGQTPAPGSGAHPQIPQSGWLSSFDSQLLADKATLEQALVDCNSRQGATWADQAMIDADKKPMNCITWFEAFAFCIWDGARLPTAAEYALALNAGSEQRKYPWGAASLDATYASYCPNPPGMPCSFTPGIILDVGSKPAGAGKWGQLDLLGSMREYELDFFNPIPPTCTDCAQLDDSQTTQRACLGGSWSDTADLIDGLGMTTSLSTRTSAGGWRCARDL